MYKIRYISFICLAFLILKSKAQNFEWLKSYGTKNGFELIYGIKSLPNGGCVFIISPMSNLFGNDTLKLDTFKFVSKKIVSYFVTLDSIGRVTNVNKIGNINTDKFCSDNEGNYYINCYMRYQSAILDTFNLLKKNGRIVIAKFDKNFNLKWILQTGNDTTSLITQLRFSNNRLYFISNSSYTTNIGSKTFFLGNTRTCIIGEISPKTGTIIWSEHLYTSKIQYTIDLDITDILNLKNNLYLSGSIPLLSNGLKINSDTFSPGSGFVIKTDSIGKYISSFLIKSKNTQFYCITTEGVNLYIGGNYSDSFSWNGKKIPPEFIQNGYEKLEMLVFSVTPDFKPRWHFRPKILEKSNNKNQYCGINKIYFNSGFLYINGVFDAKIMIDSIVLKPKYSPNANYYFDLLIFKSDTMGNILWASKGGTSLGGVISGDALHGLSVFVGGFFGDTITFGMYKKISNGYYDAFITKITDFSITRGKVKQGPYCAGDTILIPYTKFGVFDTANTFFAQLSDEYGNFDNGYRQLGRLKTNKDSTIIGIFPNFKVSSSSLYRIRILSNNPPVQSYYRYDTLRLLIYSRDKANPGTPDTICFGDTIKLNTYGGTKWTWSPKYKMNDSTLRQPLVNPDTTTIYRIVIADSSGCGQSDTAFKQIVVKASPKALLDFTDSAVCSNDNIKIPVRFSGGDSANYSWKWFLVNSPKSYFPMGSGKGKLSDTLKFITSVDKTYSQKFAVILSDNCSAKRDTAFVTISQRKPVTISSKFRDTTLCYGNQINYAAQATGGVAKYYRYQWKDLISNTILSDSQILNTKAKNTLKIQLIINDGCLALGDTALFIVNVKPKLELISDLKDTTVCQNRSLSFTANAKGGDSSKYNYKWLLDNKEIGTEKNLIFSASTSTSTLTLTSTLTDHCSIPEDSIIAKITVLPAPKADFTWGIACSKTKTDFTFTGKKLTNSTFEWNFDNESKAYSENASYMFSNAGNKAVKLIVKGENACNDTIVKNVEIKKQAIADFSVNDVCESDSAVFVNKSVDADEYLWKFGDGAKYRNNLAFGETRHFYQIPKTTTFLVTLVAISGCSDSVTIPVTVSQNPNSAFTYNQNGDKLNLKATSGYSNYKWKFDDKDSIIVTTENYVHTIKDWQPIKICLQITDVNNCSSQTCKTIPVSIKQVSINNNPNFKIYPNPNNGIFTIETQNSGDLEVQIYDVLGREIPFTFQSNQQTPNLQTFKLTTGKGIYFIKLKQNGVIRVVPIFVGSGL